MGVLSKTAGALGLMAAVSPLAASAAFAQSDYERGYQAGRAAAQGSYQAAPGGYDDQYQREGAGQYQDAPPPPPNYDGSTPPPPPPGYQPQPGYAVDPAADQRYQAYAEDWAQRYCIKSQGNTAGGAVIGGLLGALLGSSVSGRHDRGGGALIGGIAGAAGGAAVGSAADNATSPGCPPGYSVRRSAPAFYYDGPTYYYAAPAWYRPWYFYGGRWTYRPYPYHTYYYRHWGYGGPRGFYGRPDRWHGGWRRH